jgi:hypothetical protein
VNAVVAAAAAQPHSVAQAYAKIGKKTGARSAAEIFAAQLSPNVAPVAFDFSTIGIEAEPVKKRTNDRISWLKVAFVKNRAIVLRVEPSDANVCAWAEKVLLDDIRKPTDWAVAARFDGSVRHWYQNDVRVDNARGFGLRLFTIYVKSTDIKIDSLVRLLEFVASSLNRNTDHKLDVRVPNPAEIIWAQDVVYQEIFGTEAAYEHLRRVTNSHAFSKEFYAANIPEIHAHFRTGKFTIRQAVALHAPLDEIDVDEMAATELDGIPLNPVHNGGVHPSPTLSVPPAATLRPDANNVLALPNPGYTSDDDDMEDDA